MLEGVIILQRQHLTYQVSRVGVALLCVMLATGCVMLGTTISNMPVRGVGGVAHWLHGVFRLLQLCIGHVFVMYSLHVIGVGRIAPLRAADRGYQNFDIFLAWRGCGTPRGGPYWGRAMPAGHKKRGPKSAPHGVIRGKFMHYLRFAASRSNSFRASDSLIDRARLKDRTAFVTSSAVLF